MGFSNNKMLTNIILINKNKNSKLIYDSISMKFTSDAMHTRNINIYITLCLQICIYSCVLFNIYSYCGGKSPNWYIRPSALFQDMDTSKEE